MDVFLQVTEASARKNLFMIQTKLRCIHHQRTLHDIEERFVILKLKKTKPEKCWWLKNARNLVKPVHFDQTYEKSLAVEQVELALKPLTSFETSANLQLEPTSRCCLN